MEVLERTEQTLEWLKQNNSDVLTLALDQLTLGRAYFQQTLSQCHGGADDDCQALQQAACWLDQAVTGLQEAGQQQYLPLGLLTRTALHRHIGDHTRAHQDLQEVFDIAEPSGMRLQLTDYHLEMARLLLAENDSDGARQHTEEAGRLIEETGYHRRDAELAELQRSLSA